MQHADGLRRVSVSIGGVAATEITYAGAAPGSVAGAMKVTVRIPQSVASGSIPVILKVGDVTSQPGLMVNVQ